MQSGVAAAGTAPGLAIEGDQDGRFAERLGGARRHDAEHARVPVLFAEHDRRGGDLGGGEHHLFLHRAFGAAPVLVVPLEDLGRDLGLGVTGRTQQLHYEIGKHKHPKAVKMSPVN